VGSGDGWLSAGGKLCVLSSWVAIGSGVLGTVGMGDGVEEGGVGALGVGKAGVEVKRGARVSV
jgi:hypothetical protein